VVLTKFADKKLRIS